MLSYLFCILADLYLFSYFPFVVTTVVTGKTRRARVLRKQDP